jgi:hypothetical protein
MVFTADQVNSLSTFIDIKTNDQLIPIPKLQFEVFPVECVRNWVTFAIFCPNLVDISDPIFLMTPENPKPKTYIVCPTYYNNPDTWPCDDSFFQLSVETNLTQYVCILSIPFRFNFNQIIINIMTYQNREKCGSIDLYFLFVFFSFLLI